MKEHVLWHLETSPPVRIHQHAIVQYSDDGGWTVLQDLSETDGPGPSQGNGQGSSQVGSSGEVDKFNITGEFDTRFIVIREQ